MFSNTDDDCRCSCCYWHCCCCCQSRAIKHRRSVHQIPAAADGNCIYTLAWRLGQGRAGNGRTCPTTMTAQPRVLHFCCCSSFVDYYAKGVNNSYVCPRTCMNIHAHTRTHTRTHTLCLILAILKFPTWPPALMALITWWANVFSLQSRLITVPCLSTTRTWSKMIGIPSRCSPFCKCHALNLAYM